MSAVSTGVAPLVPPELSEFAERAQRYLRTRLERPDLEVTDAYQAVGGGSRVTRAVGFHWTESGAERHERLVFRLDPPARILESNRHLEFEMYSAFFPVDGVPVPEPILVEEDPEPLGMTFLLTRWVPGTGAKAAIMRPEYDEIRPAIGRQMFEIIGTIARTPVAELRLPIATARQRDWHDHLDHIEKDWAQHTLGPSPVYDGVIRYLRRNPPPAGQRTAVHGDFRIGNFLYTADSGIQAVLDWELAHLGDPHEDLAYALLPYWRPLAFPDLVAGAITEAEAIKVWEKMSGLVANRECLRLWMMFAYVRLAPILSTGAYYVAHGEATDALQTATGITEPPRFSIMAADLMELLES